MKYNSNYSLMQYQDSDDVEEEDNIFNPWLVQNAKVFLGGEISGWREDVINYFKDSGFEFIDPVDDNWSEENIYSELADLVNATTRVFLRGGEGTEHEKDFLDEIGLPYKEFDDVEELTSYIEDTDKLQKLQDVVLDNKVTNPIKVFEDLEELLSEYPEAIDELQKSDPDADVIAYAKDLGLYNYFQKGMIKTANSYRHGCLEATIPEDLERYILKDIMSEIDINKLRTSEQTLGLETESHITVLYGAGDNCSPDKAIEIVKKYFNKPLKIKSDDKISYFEGDAGNVAIIKVYSEDLERLREDLLQDFDNASEFTEYVPHITIAYLKPGEKLDIEEVPVFEWETQKLILSQRDGSTDNIYLREELDQDYITVISAINSFLKSGSLTDQILDTINNSGLSSLNNKWLLENDVYVHGNDSTELSDVGLVLTTQDMETASNYSGYGDGYIHFFKKPDKVLDLSSKDSEDMDKVVERAFEYPSYFDEYLLVSVDCNSAEMPEGSDYYSSLEELIRGAFAPDDIVDSAEGFDNPDFHMWFYDEFGSDYDFVQTPDGGVVLNSENIQSTTIPWDPDWFFEDKEGLEEIVQYLKTAGDYADAYPVEIFLNNRDKFLGNLGDNEDYNDYSNWRGSFYGVPHLRQRVVDMMNYPDSQLVEQGSDYNESLYEKSETGQESGEIDTDQGIDGKDLEDYVESQEELEEPQIIRSRQ